jgi:hypothetical protein
LTNGYPNKNNNNKVKSKPLELRSRVKTNFNFNFFLEFLEKFLEKNIFEKWTQSRWQSLAW